MLCCAPEVGRERHLFFLGPAAHTFREYPEFELGGALSVGVRGMSASDQVFKEVLRRLWEGGSKACTEVYLSISIHLHYNRQEKH